MTKTRVFVALVALALAVPFLVGAEPTIADIAVYGDVAYAGEAEIDAVDDAGRARKHIQRRLEC